MQSSHADPERVQADKSHMPSLYLHIGIVAIIVVSCILAWVGKVGYATYALAGLALVLGTLRLVMRDNSPWKIRGVVFDVFINYSLAIGLVGTYLSIAALLH